MWRLLAEDVSTPAAGKTSEEKTDINNHELKSFTTKGRIFQEIRACRIAFEMGSLIPKAQKAAGG